MLKDILIILRDILLADTTIKGYVGQNISVKSLPNTRLSKQITLRKSYGKSNSIITATNSTIFITIWVKQKDVEEPYKTCADIAHRVIDLFNRKGSSLNSSDLIVNQVVKTDAEINYSDEGEYWFCTIVFEVVHNE